MPASVGLTIAIIGCQISGPMHAPIEEQPQFKGARNGESAPMDLAIPTPNHERMWTATARGPVFTPSLAVRGYYTFIMFSAPWCDACKKIWGQIPAYLEKYPNVAAVDLDIGSNSPNGTLDGPEGLIVTDIGCGGNALPAAMIIHPLGQTAATACSGDDIMALLEKLGTRKYERPIHFESPGIVFFSGDPSAMKNSVMRADTTAADAGMVDATTLMDLDSGVVDSGIANPSFQP